MRTLGPQPARRSAISLLALVLVACGGRPPPVPDYPPLPTIPRATSEGSSSVELSLLRVEFRVDEAGRFTKTIHDRYKILNQEGVEGWGATEARWSPWHMDRPEIHATVTSTTGVVTTLDPAALSEAAAYPDAPDLYGDERVLRGPLPNVGPGVVVDEVVTMRTTRPNVGGSEVFELPFQVGVPREKVELVVDMPEGMPFKYDLRDAKVTTGDVVTGGRRVVTFTGGPYAPLKRVEPAAPSDIVEWPSVAFATTTSWQPIAKEYRRIVDQKLEGANLEGVVAKVVDAADAPQVKAAKLLAWARARVRYVGIEFGDSSVIPRTPDETLKHGYGDCKDQAVLLVGLLRAAGVPANVALLNAGTGEDVDPGLPGLNVFNHAIVVMPGATPTWIDPTSSRARAGDLPTGDQGRYALVVDGDATALTRTPHTDHAENTYREVRQVYLSDYGTSRIVETTTSTGAIERVQRDNFDGGATERAKWHKGYALRTYASDSPGKLEISDVNDLAIPFSMTVEAKESRRGTTGVSDAALYLDSDAVTSMIPSSLVAGDERHTDLALATPYEATVVYEVHAPAGFVVDEKPSATDVALGPAKWRRTVDVRADGVVEVTVHFVLPKARWSAAEVNEFRKAFATLTAEKREPVTFVHEGERLHRARAYDKELATYRAEVAKAPTAVLPKLRMALALRTLGFGATARKLADEIAATNPKEADFWDNIAFIRESDLLGRSDLPGWDRDGAITAYRAALERDPLDLYAATSLGTLLELNAAAERYAPGSQLEESIATFQKIPAEKLASYRDGRWDNEILFNLMWSGHYEAVRDLAKKKERSKLPEVPLIVASAMLGGANAGVAEVTRLAIPEASRSVTIEGAAEVLVWLRHYPEAAALLTVAAAASSDPRQQSRAKILAKTTVVDVRALPATKPEEVAKKVLLSCVLRAPTLNDDLVPLVSSALAPTKPSTDMPRYCAILGASGAISELQRPSLADVMASMVELHTDGSDDVGYRVTMKAMGSTAESVFVARQGKQLRLRAISARSSELGCEALSLAKAGRKAAATQWLDWAKELDKAGDGDDPLRDTPFRRLWTDKKDDVEASAAALCAAGEHGEIAAPVLSAARAKATGDRALALLHALAMSYFDDSHKTEFLAAATALHRDAPTSKVAYWMNAEALRALGKFQEERDLQADRVAKAPTDPDALAALAAAEDHLGHNKEARAVGERWIATGKGGAGAFNEQAWRSLFGGTVTDQEIGYALQAVALAPTSYAYMNTLAALDAEAGHIADAVERFRKSLDLRAGKEPTESDWFVLGRIAEQLALPDEARAAYRKIEPGSKKSGASALFHLAEKRLAALK